MVPISVGLWTPPPLPPIPGNSFLFSVHVNNRRCANGSFSNENSQTINSYDRILRVESYLLNLRRSADTLSTGRQRAVSFPVHVLVPVQAAEATDGNAFALRRFITGMLGMLRLVLRRELRWCRLRCRRQRRGCPCLCLAMRTRQGFLKAYERTEKRESRLVS